MKGKIKLVFQIIIIIFGFFSIAFISYCFYETYTDETIFLNEDQPIQINPNEWNPYGWYT
jgi:hypothetical protein